MSEFDQRIKKELAGETAAIDEMLAKEGGLPDLVSAAFHGSMRRWVVLIGVMTVITGGLMIWCGYEFFRAATVDDRVYWGVWFLAAGMAQMALKQWQWMEMNRASLMREVKRLELAVATLAERSK